MLILCSYFYYLCSVQLQKRYSDTLTYNQVQKLGNTAVFFAKNILDLNKTKLLKLVYLCEELFVKKYASPFLGLPFYAWKFGPVQKELYINIDPSLISEEAPEHPSLLADYIATRKAGNSYQVIALKEFNDDDFSDDEISIMNHIAQTYKNHGGSMLVSLTHKDTSLWYRTVIKEAGLLERFEKQIQSASDLTLDFADLLDDEDAKNFYYSQLEMLEFSNSLK